METDGFELKGSEHGETSVNVQKTRRVLHFSDGVMEELSGSEDELDTPARKPEESINDKDLSWVPYIRSKAFKAGNNVLAGIDYVGGGLASFLGITSSELEIAAANRAYMEQTEKADDVYCDTWKPIESDTVVSSEAKGANSK